MYRKKIAVDFDGTLCKHEFPEIGIIESKHRKVIEYIKQQKANGAIIILWTCREDTPERQYLTESVDWCKKNNIPIDYINCYYQPEFKGLASRKVCCDEYIDDRAINVDDVDFESKHKPTIITFSGKARHGKDESANILKRLLLKQGKKVLRINYADHLKFVNALYVEQDPEKTPEDLSKDIFLKSDENRTKWQLFGTDEVRTEHPNYWVDTVINIVKILKNQHYDYVLISDCRFPNEIRRWKEEGYSIISVHIERPNFDNGLTEEQKNHSTKTALNNFLFDIRIQAEALA